MDKGGGQGGSITIFFQKIFCLTLPKNFIGEPIRVSLISGTEKVCEQDAGGGIKFFRRKLLSHSAEKFRRGPL